MVVILGIQMIPLTNDPLPGNAAYVAVPPWEPQSSILYQAGVSLIVWTGQYSDVSQLDSSSRTS